MTAVKRNKAGDTSLLKLKEILMDEAMKLEGNDPERAKQLMEEIMRGIMESASGKARPFRPPRPKGAV